VPLKTVITFLVVLLFGQAYGTALASEVTTDKTPELLNALGCKACHKLVGDGGNLAPALDHIGSRMTRSQIDKHLATHLTPNQDAFMPSYNTSSPAELKQLSDFLYNLQ